MAVKKESLKKPALAAVKKPAAKPAAKSVAKPAAKPAAKSAAKSVAKPAAKSVAKPAANKQWVFLFNDEKGVAKAAVSWSATRELLGGKGAGLFDMTRKGVPVPPGFTLSTEVCDEFVRAGNKIPKDAWEQALKAVAAVEKSTGKVFGGGK